MGSKMRNHDNEIRDEKTGNTRPNDEGKVLSNPSSVSRDDIDNTRKKGASA